MAKSEADKLWAALVKECRDAGYGDLDEIIAGMGGNPDAPIEPPKNFCGTMEILERCRAGQNPDDVVKDVTGFSVKELETAKRKQCPECGLLFGKHRLRCSQYKPKRK